MANTRAHPPGMEPLARLLREHMEHEGLRVSDLAKATGLDRRHVSGIVNKKTPYKREPEIATMQALAKVPGLSIERIARAVAESTGRPVPPPPAAQSMSALRMSVHGIVDQLAEDDLPRAMKMLAALL